MTAQTTAYPRIYRILPVVGGIALVAGTFAVDLMVAGDGATAPVQLSLISTGVVLAVVGVVSRSMRLGALLAKLALLILVTAVLVVLLEGAFRVAGYDFARFSRAARAIPIYYHRPTLHAGEGFFRRDGPARWRGRPLSAFLHLHGIEGEPYADEQPVVIEYDAQGFRNPPGLVDWEIAVAGDSFVELGFLPYEQLFTTHLARRLGVRVKNLGVSHTGPLSQEFYLRAYGRAPSTREAILCFFEGNDLYDMEREMRHSSYFHRTGQTLVAPRKRQSSLLQAIHDELVSLPLRAAEGPAARASTPQYGQNAWFVTPSGEEHAMTVGVLPPVWDRLREEQRANLIAALEKFAGSARAAGLRPWVVCIPDSHRVFHGHIRYEDPQSEFARWEPGDFARGLGRVCRDLGIEFVDPYPALQREVEAGRAPYNLIGDTHLSALGSRVMGDVLADALMRRSGAERPESRPEVEP